MTATEIMEMMNKADCKNGVIFENLIRGNLIFRQHNKIMVSISGGSDSDIVLDICEKIKGDKEVEYVWFDTGVEYQATKDHLKYLEERYGIEIKRIKAIKSIPTCVREYGQPFLSKFISETMERLQVHGFDWTDMTYEEMIEKYPDCKSAVMWWCNGYTLQDENKKSIFNINRYKWLKEFIIENPPQFKISAKCCTYAKKNVSKRAIKENDFDLSVIGVRKLEGGCGQWLIKAVLFRTITALTSICQSFGIPIRTNVTMSRRSISGTVTAISNMECAGLGAWGVRFHFSWKAICRPSPLMSRNCIKPARQSSKIPTNTPELFGVFGRK